MGPDEQYVVATAKDMPRDALHLRHARLLGAAEAARRPVRAAEAGLLSALGPLRKPTPETPTPDVPRNTLF